MKGVPNAVLGYSTDMRLYKSWDFRCLKPKPGVPIPEWPHYEMNSFREAKSEEELKKVPEIPFDKNFFNFEDPKVLMAFSGNSTKSLNLWKSTYGFDWAAEIPGVHHRAEYDKMYQHCLKAEYSSYAKTCKKKGLFKCCAFG